MVHSNTLEDYRLTLRLIQEAARQTSTVVSLLQAGYLAIISLANLRSSVEGVLVLFFLLPIPIWIVSLILAIQVFMPISVGQDASDWTKLQKAEREKYRLLRWSQYALYAGLAAMFLCVVVYFAFVPAPTQQPVVVVTPTATPTETPTPTMIATPTETPVSTATPLAPSGPQVTSTTTVTVTPAASATPTVSSP